MTTDNIVFKKNGLVVTVATSTDEETLIKALTVKTYPKTVFDTDPDSPNYGPNTTKILDLLLNVEQRITIRGFLATSLGDSDTNSAAQSKKSDLKKVFLGGGTCTMTYEGSDIVVGVEKLSVKRLDNDGRSSQSGEAEFSVTATVVRGENMI